MCAVAAKDVGDINAPDARTARTMLLTASQSCLSKEKNGLRIDYCEDCSGYLKTYDGQGSEAVLLADWTSLHLDILARDRGLKRYAASLYEV